MKLYETTFICHCEEDGDFNVIHPLLPIKRTSLVFVSCPKCRKEASMISYSVKEVDQ